MIRLQLVALFCSATAFAQSNAVSAPILGNIFPLHAPSYQVYDEYGTDTNDVVQISSLHRASVSCRDTTSIVGLLTCATVTDSSLGSTTAVNNNHFRNTTGIDVQQFTDAAFWAAYLGPASTYITIGARWVTLLNGIVGVGVSYPIIALDTTVTVPSAGQTAVTINMDGIWDVGTTSVTVAAGTFTCYKCTVTIHTTAIAGGGFLKLLDNTYNQQVWVASGVGIVKSSKPTVTVTIPVVNQTSSSPGVERQLRVAGLTGVHDPLARPNEIGLSQAYPNPVNGAATMTLDLPSSTHTLLRIFDLEGRCIRTLTDGIMPAGTTTFQLDGAGLAPGTYVISLEAMERTVSKMCNVVK